MAQETLQNTETERMEEPGDEEEHQETLSPGPDMAAAPIDLLHTQGHTDQNAHLNGRGVPS